MELQEGIEVEGRRSFLGSARRRFGTRVRGVAGGRGAPGSRRAGRSLRSAAAAPLLALLSATVPAAGAAQEAEPVHVVFSVRGADGGPPVEGAAVLLAPGGRVAVTDARGLAAFRDLPPGTYLARVHHIGYTDQADSVTVDASTGELRVELLRGALEVEPLRVTVTGRNARLVEVGFYERRASARGGFFVDREEIAAHRFGNTWQVFETKREALLRRETRCLAIWIDGRRYYRVARIRSGRVLYHALDPLPPPWRIAGIEMFRQGEYPERYENYMAENVENCPVVLIWTRRGR